MEAARSLSGAEGMNDRAAANHAAPTGRSRPKPRPNKGGTAPSVAVRPRRAVPTPAHLFGRSVETTAMLTVSEVETTGGVTTAPSVVTTTVGTSALGIATGGIVGIETGGIGGTVVRATATVRRA